MRRQLDRRRRSGFTIVEMLVVIAIITTLAAMLLPAVQKARAAAARAVCVNNLRQMALGCHLYHDANRTFPSGINQNNPASPSDITGGGWGWGALILPYMDQAPLFSKIDVTQPMTSYTVGVVDQVIPSYICPADIAGQFIPAKGSLAPSSYVACCGSDATDVGDGYATSTGGGGNPPAKGIFFVGSATTIPSITDGTSQTILLAERAYGQVKGCWAGDNGTQVTVGTQNFCVAAGVASNTTANGQCLVLAHAHLINTTTDADAGTDDFSSNHTGGCNVAFADGHVSWFQSIPSDNGTTNAANPNGYSQVSIYFQMLGTMAGNEVVPPGVQY